MRTGRWPHYLFYDIIGFSGILPGAQGRMSMFKVYEMVENIRDIAKIVLDIGRRRQLVFVRGETLALPWTLGIIILVITVIIGAV